MLNRDRFPGSLFRSGRASSGHSGWRSSLQTLGASGAILVLAAAIFVSVHHAPYAAASESGPLAADVVRSATDLNWRQSPSASLNSAGRNSVTLDPCPPGVIAAEPWYYVYIAGTGTPEAVRVTGGTCKGDSHPGTLDFTTVNPVMGCPTPRNGPARVVNEEGGHQPFKELLALPSGPPIAPA